MKSAVFQDMVPFPHRYAVTASGAGTGRGSLPSAGLPKLDSLPPPEFGGPGDHWSPETLLTGAVADCFVLTFRAVAQATGLAWTSVTCEVEGTVERIDRLTLFTGFVARATLELPSSEQLDAAQRALHKAEQACLIGNSLKARVQLQTTIVGGGKTIDPLPLSAGVTS